MMMHPVRHGCIVGSTYYAAPVDYLADVVVDVGFFTLPDPAAVQV